METKQLNLVEIKKEINNQLGDKETLGALLKTTFKGLSQSAIKPAILEGVLRGFTFEDFLKKNVYAVPFGNNYSLVTSIDYARKIGMRSGIVGKSAPKYEEEDGQIISCTITVKRKVDGEIGDYSATVFFDEYTTGRNLWTSKPRTMIAKVAEMHALRMACPEELSQTYIEEDVESESIEVENITEGLEKKINGCKTVDELRALYKENEGLGKDFAKLVTNKKKELEYEKA